MINNHIVIMKSPVRIPQWNVCVEKSQSCFFFMSYAQHFELPCCWSAVRKKGASPFIAAETSLPYPAHCGRSLKLPLSTLAESCRATQSLTRVKRSRQEQEQKQESQQLCDVTFRGGGVSSAAGRHKVPEVRFKIIRTICGTLCVDFQLVC